MSECEQTVFITSFKGQDLTGAYAFGKVKPISSGPLIETFKLDQLTRMAHAALKDSKPDDWLICSGHMILGILTAVEFIRRHGRLNVLIWHAKHKRYIPRVLKASMLADLNDPALEEILLNEVGLEL